MVGKLAGKILKIFVMYQVGTCMVHCPFPCNVLAMYQPGTLVLAPSDMREVEERYENMSQERLHGMQRPKPPQANSTNTNKASKSDDKPDNLTQPGPSQPGQAGEPGSGGLSDDAGENGSEELGPPPETHPSGSDEDEVVDSDKMGSDVGYESYGLADL